MEGYHCRRYQEGDEVAEVILGSSITEVHSIFRFKIFFLF